MSGRTWLAGSLLALLTAAPGHAQNVTLQGPVDSIDATQGVVEIRMLNGNRRFMVNPDAELIINGRRGGVLADIQYSARVRVLGWRQGNGQLHAERLWVEQPSAPTRLAAVQPGTVITGEVRGMFPHGGVVILNTPTGYRSVALGTAPIMMDGRPVTLFDLAIGDRIQVQQHVPRGGVSPVPNLALVLTPSRVAGYRETFRAPVRTQDPLPAQNVDPAAPGRLP